MADLIFDRTQADVDEVARLTEGMKARTLTEEERKQYFSAMKGRYSYTDLNRVEAKTAEVAAMLTARGYPTAVVTRTNWTDDDKMHHADIVRYLDNIATIRRILPEVMAPPAVPISRWLDYTAANDIERTLWAVETALDGITQYLRRCGTFAAGGSYAAQIIRRA